MYAEGRGVAKDDAEALKWFRAAADKGNARAQANLGWMFYNGRGVPKDYDSAVQWYRKSAEQGNAIGQFNLAVVYANGHGVPQDAVEAYMWYSLAAAQGNAEAGNRMNALAKQMTPAQVAEAQRRASDWAAQHPHR